MKLLLWPRHFLSPRIQVKYMKKILTEKQLYRRLTFLLLLHLRQLIFA